MRKGEDQNIEFKESWRDDVLKTVCAFANTEGGTVYVGINDKGKNVEVKNIKKLLEDIPNKIKDMLGVIANVKSTKRNNYSVIKINIKKYKAPISYKGKFYMRSGSTTSDLRGNSLSRFLLSSSGITWESIIEPDSSIKDINVKTVRHFQGLAKKRYPFIAKEKDAKLVIQKLNLMKGNNLKRAGILLFGKDPKRYFTSAFVQVGRFISESEVISTDIIEGNLFEQLEKTIEVLRVKYLENRFYYEGIYRKEDLIYPEEALREAVINSVIHRDYIGPHIQLKIYDNALHLWNVGKLSNEITFAQLKKPHSSYPRNELLADIFFKAGLIESWGRGTLKIINKCKEKNLPEPKFIGEHGGFSVTFKKGKISQETNEGLNERQVEVVKFIKVEGQITNKEYQKKFGLKKRQSTDDLKKLEDKGVLMRVGATGRGTYYTLKGR